MPNSFLKDFAKWDVFLKPTLYATSLTVIVLFSSKSFAVFNRWFIINCFVFKPESAFSFLNRLDSLNPISLLKFETENSVLSISLSIIETYLLYKIFIKFVG